MNDRRNNWKEDIGKAARERAVKRQELLNELARLRQELSVCNVRSADYERLMAERAEVTAKLATL